MKRFLFLYCIICAVSCAEEMERKPLTLHILYPQGGIGDHGLADMIHNEVIFGRWQFDLEVNEIEVCKGAEAGDVCDAEAAAKAALEDLFSVFPRENQLLVTVGSPYHEVLKQHECNFNGTKVLHLDSMANSCRDLRSVIYRMYGPSFLAGVAAMEQLKRDNEKGFWREPKELRAGIISVDYHQSTREYINGFKAGVLHAGGEILDSDVVSIPEYLSALEKRERAKTIASDFIHRAVPVIFPVDSKISESAIGVLSDFRNEQRESLVTDDGTVIPGPAYAIGVDSDKNMLHSMVMLGSVVKHMDHTVREAMYEVSNGEFAFGATIVGFDDGSTEFIYNLSVYDGQVAQSIDDAHAAALDAVLQAEF